MDRTLNQLLRYFVPSLNKHLSDDHLASLVCDELSLADRWIVRNHLRECWQCRLRKEDLEGPRSKRILDLDREALNSEKLPEVPRTEFSQRLRLHLKDVAPQEKSAHRFFRVPLLKLPLRHPALVTCLVFGFTTILTFTFWRQQRVPRINSNTLLVSAERWDTPNLASTSGVVYQSVRITFSKQAKKETIARSIYRDTQGKRLPRQAKLDATEEQLQSTLIAAGLDWNEPISASSYQQWHDRQSVHEDRITRAGKHLLTLTTTVPDGTISEQSFTVRDTDFHPIQRTIAFRDSQTIEVAELGFKILPWASVDASLFEPSSGASPLLASNSSLARPLLPLSETVTDEQLDETELETRLVLNKLGADTGEQIEIGRIQHGVEVRGLVDTEERKHLLQSQLHIVPHLTVSIQSMADVKDNLPAHGAEGDIKAASIPDEKSPIEKYLLASGRSVSAINVLAHRLFENALTISQESKAIRDLQSRFVAGAPKTIIASATLTELIYSHQQRLQVALKQERELLAEVRGAPANYDGASTPGLPLIEAASRLLALCQELTQTNNSHTRSADRILSEMSSSVEALSLDIHEAYAKPRQDDSPLNGRR